MTGMLVGCIFAAFFLGAGCRLMEVALMLKSQELEYLAKLLWAVALVLHATNVQAWCLHVRGGGGNFPYRQRS